MKKLIKKIILALSSACLAFILSNGQNIIYIGITSILAFILMFYITRKEKFIFTKKNILISLLPSLYLTMYYVYFFKEKATDLLGPILGFNFIKHHNVFIIGIFGVLSFISILYFIYKFVEIILPKIIDFFKNMKKEEKIFLSSSLIIGTIIVIFISFKTCVFINPYISNKKYVSDVIFTTDSTILVSGDSFLKISHPENDIRQPLFGLFAMPFSIVAHLISDGLMFIVDRNIVYPVVLTILQFGINAIGIILLSRLLKLKGKNAVYFYLLLGLSFPYLLFSFTVEQYTISVFYLILFIYYFFTEKKTNYLYVASTGTLLTSGILFSLISKARDFKGWFKDLWKCFIVFVSFTVISGQLPQFFSAGDTIGRLSGNFATHIPFQDKIFQFTYFIRSIFIAPNGILNGDLYRMPIANKIEIIGIIILALCILSFILNRKEKIALLSIGWIVFSFLLLCIAGWGTTENGLILYSLYFAFAFFILYYLLIKKLFKNRIFDILMITSITVVTYFSFTEIIDIIKFGITYFKM